MVSAFEDGVLESFADVLKNNRSALRREQLLAKVVAIASDSGQGKAPGEGPAAPDWARPAIRGERLARSADRPRPSRRRSHILEAP